MSQKRQRRLPSEAARYEIGYAKPPKATQFKTGHSGNPQGRPRGSGKKNNGRLDAIIFEEAYRTAVINDPSGPSSIPIVQVVVRSLAHKAAKGDQRAQRLFTELVATVERDKKREFQEQLLNNPIVGRIERVILDPDDAAFTRDILRERIEAMANRTLKHDED